MQTEKKYYCHICNAKDATVEDLWVDDLSGNPEDGTVPTCLDCAVRYDIEYGMNRVEEVLGLPICRYCEKVPTWRTQTRQGEVIYQWCQCGATEHPDNAKQTSSTAVEDETEAKEEKND